MLKQVLYFVVSRKIFYISYEILSNTIEAYHFIFFNLAIFLRKCLNPYENDMLKAYYI